MWERGVGETSACGSGACATVVALVRQGLLDREARVQFKEGHLDIALDANGSVLMSGPAEVAFRGTFATRLSA